MAANPVRILAASKRGIGIGSPGLRGKSAELTPIEGTIQSADARSNNVQSEWNLALLFLALLPRVTAGLLVLNG